MFALATMLLTGNVWANAMLHEQYLQLRAGQGDTLPGTTTSLRSSEHDNIPSAEINTIINYPYETVATALAAIENWCQILPLHFNIKACTHEGGQGTQSLTVYSGRKIYQVPEEGYRMDYRFNLIRYYDDHLTLQLNAAQGPVNTRDYRIELDALRVEEGTLLHIHYSYQPSLLSNVLTNGYLNTIGRNKVGFSRIEQEGVLRPVSGIRGAIERNVMRYHLAIEAFLGSRSLPAASRYEASLVNWISQNNSFPLQLHEMEKDEYLTIKRREKDNQQRLQRALNRQVNLAANP